MRFPTAWFSCRAPIPSGGRSASRQSRGRTTPYFIDRYEVTNRQFKQFVDQGGYQKREYWKTPFVRDGKPVSWDEAMAVFRDTTGRPGPSTWEGGTFPTGNDDLPVSGVSWYEAAAYAEFAGKSLPTISHWYLAADIRVSPLLIPASNFAGKGLAKRGQLPEHRTVRHLRHGRECPGMGVERGR